MRGLDDVIVADGDEVAPDLMLRALTAGELVYPNGATQIFDAVGGTTYVENGRPTRGEWYVDEEGRFGSFWPPDYRADYALHWIVEDGIIAGLRFTDRAGTRYDGHYRARTAASAHPGATERRTGNK
ncbi:hypothetical protein [Kribbella sp. HUAS MG21]|jgi:hypothetical protein|uniref:Uncharacterized protein n=1 Tax=Kribbella sp. HUAS MG21 TaxID=3160966 RepID=A0AAU7TAA5_9ACTN